MVKEKLVQCANEAGLGGEGADALLGLRWVEECEEQGRYIARYRYRPTVGTEETA